MSNDRVFEIKCGCCGARIHVDPRTRSVYFTEKTGEERSFEERVEHATSGTRQAKSKFEAGMKEEQTRREKLEQLFQEAKEKAEQDPNERPPSIWDYE